MKILYIVNSFENGAIPNILLDIVPELKINGCDITFLALEPLPEEHLSVQRCQKMGFALSSLNLNAKISLTSIIKLKKAIKKIAPDLIHTHLGRADILTPWVKGRIPQITTFHSVKRNYNRLTLLGYKLSDKMVAHRTGVSKASIDSFYSDRFLKSKHSVIYNPVKLDRLKVTMTKSDVQKHFGWEKIENFKLISLVGRLMPVKGHSDFINAFPSIQKNNPGLCAVIAGDGPLKDSLYKQIKSAGLENHIRLAGPWNNPADLYSNSDVLVFPSHWEGLGLVPIEAMLLNCPVAASRIPAVQEFINDGENGYLFEPGNSDDLARVVERLLKSSSKVKERLAIEKEELLNRFSPIKIAQDYWELYENTLRTE